MPSSQKYAILNRLLTKGSDQPAASLGETSPDGRVTDIESRDWPNSPQPLRVVTAWTHLEIFYNVIITLLPVLFFALAIIALRLDGKDVSAFGDHYLQAIRYGPTVFPIIFAAIVARLMRSLALWKCEKGSSLGFLEQLVGSQSLARTIERFVVLQRFRCFGFCRL